MTLARLVGPFMWDSSYYGRDGLGLALTKRALLNREFVAIHLQYGTGQVQALRETNKYNNVDQ
jgi:DMSO/TMAO reductase YedYZ heme-binding membrane subunit